MACLTEWMTRGGLPLNILLLSRVPAEFSSFLHLPSFYSCHLSQLRKACCTCLCSPTFRFAPAPALSLLCPCLLYFCSFSRCRLLIQPILRPSPFLRTSTSPSLLAFSPSEAIVCLCLVFVNDIIRPRFRPPNQRPRCQAILTVVLGVPRPIRGELEATAQGPTRFSSLCAS